MEPEGLDLFKHPAIFQKTVVDLAELPVTSLPEIAFAGRSNVGKSSLINALFNHRQLAKASCTPGRTQALNYFKVKDVFHLVDMPGYGYAKAPQHHIESWTQLIKNYLQKRPQLKRVYLLIDSRHGLKPSDQEIMNMLDKSAVSYQLVFTKTDKISVMMIDQLHEKGQAECLKHSALYPHFIATSSLKKAGLENLQQAIINLIYNVDVADGLANE